MKVLSLQPLVKNNKPALMFSVPAAKKTNENCRNITELPNYYYMPVSFGVQKVNRTYTSLNKDLFEIPAHFMIGKQEDVPCPSCGRKMLNREKFAQFQSELDSVDESEYINVLEKWKDYMMPIELSAFEDIKGCLAKTPNMNKPNDIRTALVILRNSYLPQLQAIQMRRVKKMRSLANGLPDDERAVLMSKIENLKKIIKKTGEESPFRRKILIDKISKIKIQNPMKYKKLQDIAASFPTSSDIDSAWIVKYSGKKSDGQDWTSYDIALRLLSKSIANTDHILPYSTHPGHDDITNYMAMHTGCNSRKANKPFLQWYYEDKQLRQKSMNAYFKYAQQLIDSGQIDDPKYKDYVAKATQTILQASESKVQIMQ